MMAGDTVIRRFALAACCVLCCAQAAAQVNGLPQLKAEQLETGFVNLPGHPHTAYSIRLLPVSSFPQLPLPVTQQLDRIGCMIPQTYEAREPENVITGAFEKPGSCDWAVLCSVKGLIKVRGNNFRSTTLYVFFQSDYTKPVALRSQADTLWLGREWGQDYGSAWGIATRPAGLMRPRDQTDHDGIEDAFVEKSSVVHYFRDGHWTKLEGNQ
jgi:hypothetical protein